MPIPCRSLSENRQRDEKRFRKQDGASHGKHHRGLAPGPALRLTCEIKLRCTAEDGRRDEPRVRRCFGCDAAGIGEVGEWKWGSPHTHTTGQVTLTFTHTFVTHSDGVWGRRMRNKEEREGRRVGGRVVAAWRPQQTK
jgi:hypothetical protein